jgi:hypothetical protein
MRGERGGESGESGHPDRSEITYLDDLSSSGVRLKTLHMSAYQSGLDRPVSSRFSLCKGAHRNLNSVMHFSEADTGEVWGES